MGERDLCWRRIAGLLLVCSGLCLAGSEARAGFIAMKTSARVELRDGKVVLRVVTTNRGDEPAFQVRLEALHPESPKSSEAFEQVEVGRAVSHTFEWEAPGAGQRRLVIPILTHYADANYYPLSSLWHAVATFGEAPVTTIAARIDPLALDPRGMLRVWLRSLDGAPHRVALRVVTPAELAAEPTSAHADVPATGELPIEFELENFGGLPGSNYGVMVVLREERPDGIVETVVQSSVELQEPAPPPGARVWIVAAVLAAALALAGWQLGAFRRRG